MTKQPAPEKSLGQLFSDLSEQTSRLIRAEIDLVKAEVTGRLKVAGAGAGLLAAAGLLALYVIPAILATAIIALALVVDLWLSALIVTVVLLIVIAVLALLGRRRLEHASAPTSAIESVHEDIETLKGGLAS
ncbi:phage holin family protein [Cellulomonas composti]|uniref:Membrane protein n=1 Tax=Cellulomonas composti TaxID=266130 RepID=A0A511JDA6_9CELL|nr:phage holin family protein [Cellulomonas composti]GEL95926.1 membrane protein [Cellulomonas composti]